MLRIVTLTALAMIAFAANSILARLALAEGAIDAASFTGIRLIAGAAALLALASLRERRLLPASHATGGSWRAAAALFGYAAAFSFAYLRLGAGTGALILFTSVQICMLGWAIVKGERPGPVEWLGLALAVGGFVYLTAPGLVAPDPLGTVLMVAAGACWAVYSLLGRGSSAPLADTTGNFLRCVPLALILAAIGLGAPAATPLGLACAALSGALASGIGYAIWYTALPLLSRTRAAVVQLTVPTIAALGGVVFVAEALTLRLAVASVVILGGVGIAILAADRRKMAA